MSQASKALKEIASGQEYTDLVQAIEKSDYEAIAVNYQKLIQSLEEKKKQILEKIDTLPRQNKDTDRAQFISAFNRLIGSTLPQWEALNLRMKEQKVATGEVFSVGVKGDPMVRSPEGKTVIVSGVTAEKGTRLIYRVTRENDKVDFGRGVELNKEFFYSLLNQNILGKVVTTFDTIEARIKEGNLTTEVINELLAGLQNIREMANSLRPEERTGISSRILAYRKKLLMDYSTKLAFEFIENTEVQEITAISADKAPQALAAPGLFRTSSIQMLKNELFDGNKLKGYGETLKQMESGLNNMEAAMKLMEFKAGIEEVERSAKLFFDRLDVLADRLDKKVRNSIYNIAEDKVFTAEEVKNEVEKALSGPALTAELVRVFRSPGDYFSLRESACKLRNMMGSKDAQIAESAIKPYLTQKLNEAFQKQPLPSNK